MKLRYYQGLVDITSHCILDGENPPVQVFQRVLFTPDEGVYYCSAERMLDCHHLDYIAVWPPNMEVPDELRDWWNSQLNNGMTTDLAIFPWHWVVKSYEVDGPIELHTEGSPVCEFAYQGEYEDSEDDRAFDSALEDAHANHLV